VMDRGIPTEAVLAEMRVAATPTHYLGGSANWSETSWPSRGARA
jgi:hypothetical protein